MFSLRSILLKKKGTPLNKCRKNEENRKSPLEQHSNNCRRQDPLTDAKISRPKFDEKQDICIGSDISLIILIYHKERNVPLQ